MKITGLIFRFIQSSGIFFLGTVLSKLISFFLLPIYTTLIPVADMGYYDITITYMYMAISFIFFEIWSAVLRFMYDGRTVKDKYKSVKSGLTIFSCSAIIYIVGGVILGNVIEIPCLNLILVCGILQSMVSYYTFSARGFEKNIDFAISGIINVLINAIINIIMIVYLKYGFVAMYYGLIVGNIAQLFYLELRLHIIANSIQEKFDKKEITRMFRYALPLCLNTISYWFLTNFNRAALNWELGNEANGLYAIGNRFGMLITLITTCFTYAWQDISFSYAGHQHNENKFYSYACNLYMKFLIVGLYFLLPIAYYGFILMINENYQAAKGTIPLSLMVGVLSAISSFIENVFYAIKETKAVFVSTIISALSNIIIVFPLIRIMGINGANFSACVGFLINIIIQYLILRKKIDFGFNWKLFFVLLIICIPIFRYYNTMSLVGSIWLWIFAIVMTIVVLKNEIVLFLKNNNLLK